MALRGRLEGLSMFKYLVLVTLLSYQVVQAHANSYVQKSVFNGDNVISILKKNGFNEFQRESILSQNKGLRQLFLTLDTKYLLQAEKGAVELRLYDSQGNHAFRVWRDSTNFGVQAFKPEFTTTIERFDGHVYGSLMNSILNKVDSNWIASRFIDAYVFDVRPSTLERGAPYSLNVEKKYDQGQFIKYGEVTQTSLKIEGRSLRKIFVRSAGGGVFITDQDLQKQRLFYAPANYLRVASLFQPFRRHPITKRLQPHNGVDFELAEGDPVLAARQGVVVRFGRSRAGGNFIVLAHTNGMETAYNHLMRVSSRIRRGLRVTAGEKIAEVGCTGYCTRPHLHFALKIKGRMVDPLKYIKPFPLSMENLLEARIAQF